MKEKNGKRKGELCPALSQKAHKNTIKIIVGEKNNCNL